MAQKVIDNKVEILHKLCFEDSTPQEFDSLELKFTEKDIDFMNEFKKIFELGVNQLYKFLKKLEDEGKDLDETSIDYYVDLLKNGPLYSFVQIYISDPNNKIPYFEKTPDCLGANGMYSIITTSSMFSSDYPQGVTTDIYNKIPKVCQETVTSSMKAVEDIFRGNLYCSVLMDNTLPMIDKIPGERMKGDLEFVKKANGNYNIKDITFYNAVKEASVEIFQKIKEKIGEERYRMLEYRKTVNPFDSYNINNAEKKKWTKSYKDVVTEIGATEHYDLSGELYDSDERREKSKANIPNENADKEYKLNTNQGQLGS